MTDAYKEGLLVLVLMLSSMTCGYFIRVWREESERKGERRV